MSIPKSVAETIEDHVVLEVEGIDRMYLNVYQPKLQHGKGVVGFFRFHRGEAFATALVMSRMTRKFVASIERFVADNDIPMVSFKKGQRKDDVALAYYAEFDRKKVSSSLARQGKGVSPSHRDTSSPRVGPNLPLAGSLDGDGQPLLFLLHRQGLRAVLPQVRIGRSTALSQE